MKDYTDITILMDRSGSMNTIKTQMESALDEFVQQHKQNPNTRLTLIQFDGEDDQDVAFTARRIGNVEPIKLNPRGWTPLCDALCKAIDNTGKRFRDCIATDRPSRVLFIIITDGAENASKQFKRADVQHRISHQRDHYNWQFVYMGANQDAYQEAASYGIPKMHTMNFSPMFVGEDSNYMTSNTVAYARSGTMKTFDPQEQEANRKGTKTVGTT